MIDSMKCCALAVTNNYLEDVKIAVRPATLLKSDSNTGVFL